MRARNSGSLVLDKRNRQWFFYWYADGKRLSKRIGTKDQYPTKTSAWTAAKPLRDAVELAKPVSELNIETKLTVSVLVDEWREKRMPKRETTRRGLEAWIKNHILPQWGKSPITALKSKPVEEWLKDLPLSPKSRVILGT
jgi:integrase